MEITIKINGRMVSVEVSGEVAECYGQFQHKSENLSHEKRRHWDGREFDEYIAATEGLLPYQPTPEDIVCQRETLTLLLSILDTCTAISKSVFCFMRCTVTVMPKSVCCADAPRFQLLRA